jgi:ABC-2 type transport system permease protein
MRPVSWLLPPSHVFEGMRAIVTGGDFRGTTLLWSTCLSALYILLAAGFFSRIHRQAVRTGLLARYSAESVS